MIGEESVEAQPIAYLHRLLPMSDVDEMVAETNRYAEQELAKKGPLPPYSRFQLKFVYIIGLK